MTLWDTKALEGLLHGFKDAVEKEVFQELSADHFCIRNSFLRSPHQDVSLHSVHLPAHPSNKHDLKILSTILITWHLVSNIFFEQGLAIFQFIFWILGSFWCVALSGSGNPL